ncbi:MAG TPA: PadR family transcriptional regulator [Caulobacterales bacterium]|jgi:DNA-binding PadR family transcriptional regulator|nr:PadR family transcriptional regulator [Caulobacterales bacterium]
MNGQRHWRHARRHAMGPGLDFMVRHRGRHRHRGGGKRLFEQGDLRWAALALIAEKPRHGYELIKAIEEASGGAYAPSPGVIYPTLTFLEELGYAKAEAAEGGKKLYTITAEGRAILDARKVEVDALFAFLAETRARHARPAPEIHRAWENLRTALNLKVAAAALTPEQVRAITQALDAAASTIERS